MENKVVLLTGGTGFLGSNIAKELVRKRVKLVLLVRTKSSLSRISCVIHDIEIVNIDKVPISDIFKKHKIDLVINAAASYGRKGETIEEVFNANCLFPLSLIMNSIENSVAEFINIGTSLQPFVNEYSLTKHQFVEWLIFYKKKIKIKNVVLEYFYGPEDDSWKFVTMLFENFRLKKPCIDFTSGEQTRNFVFIKDVIDAFFKIIESEQKNSEINLYHIKSNENITIKNLALLCKKISNNTTTKLNFGAIKDRDNDAPIVDNKNYISIQNWFPQTTLREGLEITWEYINNKNN